MYVHICIADDNAWNVTTICTVNILNKMLHEILQGGWMIFHFSIVQVHFIFL